MKTVTLRDWPRQHSAWVQGLRLIVTRRLHWFKNTAPGRKPHNHAGQRPGKPGPLLTPISGGFQRHPESLVAARAQKTGPTVATRPRPGTSNHEPGMAVAIDRRFLTACKAFQRRDRERRQLAGDIDRQLNHGRDQ